MIVYNLTDMPPPGKKGAAPRALKFRGAVINPGESATVPDRPLRELSGWIRANRASVDQIPEWYQQAKRTAQPILMEAKEGDTVVIPAGTYGESDGELEFDDEPPTKVSKKGKSSKKGSKSKKGK